MSYLSVNKRGFGILGAAIGLMVAQGAGTMTATAESYAEWRVSPRNGEPLPDRFDESYVLTQSASRSGSFIGRDKESSEREGKKSRST